MLPLTTVEEDILSIAASFDGFLFTGGHDVNPEIYGEKVGIIVVNYAMSEMKWKAFYLTKSCNWINLH